MPNEPLRIVVRLEDPNRIAGQIRDAVDEVVKETAAECEAVTRRNIVEMGAVDTAFMLESTYTRTSAGSGLEAARTRASARAPDRHVDAAGFTGGLLKKGTAQVVVGAPYSVHVHEGARGRAERPFLFQALVEVARKFRERLQGLFRPDRR